MIISLTGGTGFIGKRLIARHRSAGDTIRLLTRRPADDVESGEAVRLFHGDLGDRAVALRAFVEGADVLYHCAGEIRDPARMHAVHVDGTRRLLEAACRTLGRWVQLSSVGVYGAHRSGVVTEDAPGRPRGPYEESKAESDRLVMAAADAGCFALSVLRPSIVYGAEMSNRSLFQLVAAIDRGLFFFIGRPGASANYIHVDNVAEALHRCGIRAGAEGRIYNLSDWRTMECFIGTIAESLGRPAPTLRLPEVPVRWAARLAGRMPRVPLTEARVDALVTRASYPIERIERELGYVHPTSMEEGLRQLVAAWRSGRRPGQ